MSEIRQPPRHTPSNRRDELLHAAARCFLRNGYAGTAMRDIAMETGMKAGSIYYHFPSKDALYFAVYEAGVEGITAAVREALDGRVDPWERLEAACAAHLEVLLQGGVLSRLMRRDLPRKPEGLRERLVGLRDRYEAIFAHLFADLPLPEEVDRHEMRLMLIGAMNYAHTWYRPGAELPGALARNFVHFLKEPMQPGTNRNGNRRRKPERGRPGIAAR